MSTKHPIIAITGSSGAGTTSVMQTFNGIFRREGVNSTYVEGDSFHRYNRAEMRDAIAASGGKLSHFGPEANMFADLEKMFSDYSETGKGEFRKYLHDDEEAAPYGQEPGTFTPWQPLPESDLLFYEGLHGGVVTDEVDIAQFVDMLIGVVPVVNLEWIQKIHRDRSKRGYSTEAVTDTILRRMEDYVHYIVPQFTRTHINFQRVPVVDTSNPFTARWIPTADESIVVIRFKDPRGIDFPYLLSMLHDSFMSRANTIVVPGGKMELAMQLIFTPVVLRMMDRKRKAIARDGDV